MNVVKSERKANGSSGCEETGTEVCVCEGRLKEKKLNE